MNFSLLTVMILVYLGIISYLVFLGYKHTETSDDYMVAGRNIPSGIMALSYGATFISTSAIVGFGGVAAQFGFSLLWLTFLNIFIGVFVAFVFLGTRIRKMSLNLNSDTFSSFLGKRYGDRRLTIFSGLMIFVFMPAYTSIILVGGARFIEEVLLIDYDIALFILALIVGAYVITGGLKAVMYSDAFSALVIFAGMILLLIGGYRAVGGIAVGHRGLAELVNRVPEGLVEQGHQGWTAMPAFGSSLWWTVVTSIILGVGIGVLAQPQLSMRFMTVKETRSLYRAVLVGGLFIFVVTGSVYMVGPLSNLYFVETEGVIALEAAGGNPDSVIPAFISRIMPSWFLYLFMLTMISAAISTVSSLIHVQGTAFGRDIIQSIRTSNIDGAHHQEKDVSFISKIGVLIGLTAAIILAYVLPEGIIARATAFWFGVCTAGFLPLLLGALYWKRAGSHAAFWSAVSGYAVSIFGYIFLHAAEAAEIGLVYRFLGRETLLEFPWTVIDPLVYSLPVSALVFVVVSLLEKQLPQEHIDRCFENIDE